MRLIRSAIPMCWGPISNRTSARFPNNAPQVNIPGAPGAPTVYDEGRMVYRLWQSILEAFQDNQTKRNFADDVVGRGGPGAATRVNLVTLHFDQYGTRARPTMRTSTGSSPSWSGSNRAPCCSSGGATATT